MIPVTFLFCAIHMATTQLDVHLAIGQTVSQNVIYLKRMDRKLECVCLVTGKVAKTLLYCNLG